MVKSTDISNASRGTVAGLGSPRLMRIGVWARQEDQWGRSLIAGVFRYSNMRGFCEIQLLQEHIADGWDVLLNAVRPDGLILGCEIPETKGNAAPQFNCPAVLVNIPADSVRGPVVARLAMDNRAIARDVAERFLRQGFHHFAYVSFHKRIAGNYAEERHRHFSERLAEAGFECEVFEQMEPMDWAGTELRMADWLRSLPKPCAIMVCNDRHGRSVLNACRLAGVKCPEQVGVVGVDNDILLCETATPPLSSIQPDNEGAGYRAAEILCKAVQSGRMPKGAPTCHSYGVGAFVERASSQDYKGTARLVAAARRYISRHACDGIHVKDVADTLHVSVRLLQMRFAEVGGPGVREEIERIRIKRVRELLATPGRRIGDIASECGFASETSLRECFRRLHGCSMREYRKRQ